MKKEMKSIVTAFLLFAAMFMFTSCEKDDGPVPERPGPAIENIEIGSGNNAEAIIGRDFHFEMDVVAGDLIKDVQVKILQRSDADYSHEWSFEITWDESQGLKSTNVHKHFNIPGDAAEGTYDFVITVNDENGTKQEEIKTVELVDPANLPVDPVLYLWSFETNEGDSHYVNELLENPDSIKFSRDEVLNSMIFIKNVKDDGELYLLLIKKELNHLPESVEDIDLSKAIVYDVFQHENEEEVYTFSNVLFDGSGGQERPAPGLTIGASVDNNGPQPNPINGDKAWENGEYYLGVVYTNTTHDLSLHHYVELTIDGF